MTNRREFLQIGLAASTWPLASRAARAAGVAEAATLPLYKVVYDARFPASVAFARHAATLGASVVGIDGDMTRFWYDDLYHRWREGPVAIAGLTAHGPLFCFEQLARDQRMRVVFRAEHRPAANDCVAHALVGPAALVENARLEPADAGWAERMAELVTRCPPGRAEIVVAERTSLGSLPADAADSLYSWVIAPAVRI